MFRMESLNNAAGSIKKDNPLSIKSFKMHRQMTSGSKRRPKIAVSFNDESYLKIRKKEIAWAQTPLYILQGKRRSYRDLVGVPRQSHCSVVNAAETFVKINEELSSYKLSAMADSCRGADDQMAYVDRQLTLLVETVKQITCVAEVNIFDCDLRQLFKDEAG